MATIDENKFVHYSNLIDPNTVLSYKGPFTKSILSGLGNYIKEILADPEIGHKVFSIFVELAQNIYYYSTVLPEMQTKVSTFGSFIVEQTEDCYKVTAGNFVRDIDVEPIMEKAELINNLSRDDLRSYKKELRKESRSSFRAGANIGLIQVALKSSSKLEIAVEQVRPGFSFVAISTVLQK